jgi:hypothetical protein
MNLKLEKYIVDEEFDVLLLKDIPTYISSCNILPYDVLQT